MSFVPDIIKEASRNLRANMTEAEKVLWDEIKDRKV
jgi:very-short-patch-repair endonuclease